MENILSELCSDFKKLGISSVPYNLQQVFMLCAVSNYWVSYASRVKGISNDLCSYFDGLAIKVHVQDASTVFLHDIKKLFKVFPADHLVIDYNNDQSLYKANDKNLFIFLDLYNVYALNSALRRYGILGTFSDDDVRKRSFASLVFTNDGGLIDHEFDLSFTTTFLHDKKNDVPNFLEYVANKDDSSIINKWNSFFNTIATSEPCIIKYSDELKSFLPSDHGINSNLCVTTLKFLHAFILLKRLSLTPIINQDGPPTFEASKEDFDSVLKLIYQTKVPLNQLPRASIEILNLVEKKYANNMSFTRKELIDDTGWSPAKLSAALKPLEKYEILPFKKSGSNHQRVYQYKGSFKGDLNICKGGIR